MDCVFTLKYFCNFTGKLILPGLTLIFAAFSSTLGGKKKKEKPRHLQAAEKGRSPQTSTLAVRSLVACCTNLDAVWSGVTPPPPPPLDLRPFHTTQWIISCETTSLDRPSGLFIGFNNLLKTEKKTKQTVKCFLTAVISRHGCPFTRLDVAVRGVAWPRMFTPLERRVALAENPPRCLHREFLLQAVQRLQQNPVQETVVVVVVVFLCVFLYLRWATGPVPLQEVPLRPLPVSVGSSFQGTVASAEAVHEQHHEVRDLGADGHDVRPQLGVRAQTPDRMWRREVREVA